MKKSFLISMCVLFLIAITATYAFCITYDLPEGRKLYLTGYAEQYLRYGFKNDPNNLPGGGRSAGGYRGIEEAFYSVLTELHYIHNEMFEFRAGARLEGDWAWDINHENEHWGGPDGMDQAGKNMHTWTHQAQRDVLRELNVGITTRYINARLGKQTVVWGETDMFRLMDMFNPLDLRRMYVMRDADYGYAETRVPLWAAKVGVTPEVTVGPLTDVQFEFAWTPEIRQTLFNIGPRVGGPWAFPIPTDMPDLHGAVEVLELVENSVNVIGLLPPVTLKNLNIVTDNDHGSRAITMENSTVDARIRGQIGNTYVTLNAFYGWDEIPIFQKAAITTNPAVDLSAVGLPNVSSFGYLSSEFGGNVDDGFGYGLTLQKKMYRKQVIGVTAVGEANFLRSAAMAIGQVACPVLRFEGYYQMKKAIPTNWVQNIKRGAALVNAGDIPNGMTYIGQGLVDGVDGYEKKDTIRYMVGFDWALRIPFLNPNKEFFSSFQFVHEHIFGDMESVDPTTGLKSGCDDRFWSVPYSERIPRDKLDMTFLINTAYFHEMIKPQYAVGIDFNNNASYMHKVSCRFWLGDHWRPEVGWYFYTGGRQPDLSHSKFGTVGDNVYVKLQYQF